MRSLCPSGYVIIGVKKMKKITNESMSEESRKMLKLLVNGGVIGDSNIQEEKLREFRQKKLKNAYHNTELLMKNYRNIAWLLECFPDFIAAELDEPFEDIDKLINRLDVQLAYGNQKVENRLESLQKTRLVIDKINEALSIVKAKPNGGNKIYDVLYMTDNVDEFCLQMMRDYDSKTFKNVTQGDLDLETEDEKKELEQKTEDNKPLLEIVKKALGDKVQDVKLSHRLKSHPVCLASGDGVSFEMEKVLNQMPDAQGVKAGRILEINPDHDLFKSLQSVYEKEPVKIDEYASILFDQALLIAGFSIDDPVEFSNKITKLMIEASK